MSSTKDIEITAYWSGGIDGEIKITAVMIIRRYVDSTNQTSETKWDAGIYSVQDLTVNPSQEERNISEDEFKEITGQEAKEYLEENVKVKMKIKRPGAENYESSSLKTLSSYGTT